MTPLYSKAYRQALKNLEEKVDINLSSCYIESLQEIDRLNSLNDELNRVLSEVIREKTELLKAIDKFMNDWRG